MKIAIIEPVGGHGGMNYYDMGLSQGLTSVGISTILYTSDKTEIPPDINYTVKKSFKNIWGPEQKIIRAIRFIFCLLNTMYDAQLEKVKIVHYHFFHYTLLELFCVIMAKLFRFKVVVTLHDIKSFSGSHSNAAVQRILKRVDRLITHNDVSKNELIEKIRVPIEKISVIPHGNYLNSIEPGPTKSKNRAVLNIPQDCPVLLFFGQIKRVKGLDLLLNSLPDVINKYDNLKLIIAGRVWKDDFSKYETIIREKSISQNVILNIKYIADEDVPHYYRASDLIVLPYRRIYQSGVLLMAMSYKRPVIVSDLEGMIAIVENEKTGYVFKTGNSKSLSETLIHALENKAQLKKMGEAGYQKVLTEYSWDKIGWKTAILYQEVLKPK